MTNEQEKQNEIVDIAPDQIETLPYDEVVKLENTLNNKILNSPLILGGKAVIGSGDKVFKFDPEKGIWLGNANFDDAPFRVDMEGNFTTSGYIAVGGAAQDIKDYGGQIGASNLDSTVISGGKIITSLLTADNIQTGTLNASLVNVTNLNASNITTGTLTGRKVQTSDPSEPSDAVVMDSEGTFADYLRFYSSGTEVGRIWGASGPLFNLQIVGSSNQGILAISHSVSGSIIYFTPLYIGLSKYIRPVNPDELDLGSPDYRWKNLYLGSNSWICKGSLGLLQLTSGNELKAATHFLPYYSNSYNLGSSSYKWNNLYLSGNIYVNGTVDGVDISSHAANSSAHHSKTSYSSELTFNSDLIPNQSGYWDLGSSSYKWYRLYLSQGIIGGYHYTGLIDIGYTNGYDILPYGDNYGQIGYRAGYGGQSYNRRWSGIYGVTIVSGDFVLDNDFKITEEGKKGIAFLNPKNKKIAILDKKGNLYIKGKIFEKNNL